MVRRNTTPGMHGKKATSQRSEYGKQFREKQKIKRIYGITERQSRNVFQKALKKPGVTGEFIIDTLERRLDNVVFRLGLAPSRRSARQLVSHGCIRVDQRTVTIPSFQVKPGCSIAIKKEKREKKVFEHTAERVKNMTVPAWLHLEPGTLEGKVLHHPKKEDVDHSVDIQMVVAYYAR